MKKKKIFIFIILIISLSLTPVLTKQIKKQVRKKNSSLAPLTIKTAETITFNLDGKNYNMHEILEYLLQKNEQITQLMYDAAQADTNYEKFQKKYAYFLKVDGNYYKSDFPEDSITAARGSSTKNNSLSAAIARSFSTGTTLSMGMQRTYSHTQDMNADYGDPEYYQSAFFISIQQELLKNVMGYQERRQAEIFKNQSTIINDTVTYQASMLTIDAIISAWQLALFNSEYENSKLKLLETKKVRRIIYSNIQIGLNEKYDLNYWNAQVAAHTIQVSNALNNLEQQNRLVQLKFNMKESPLKKNGIAVLSNKLPEIKQNEALNNAYKNRADYTSACLALRNAKLNLEITENNALPSMKAGVKVSSVGQRDRFNDALDDSINYENPTYEVNFGLTYPLSDSEQKTNERNAAMDFEKAKLELSRTKKIVKNDVINSIQNIKTAYTRYQKARQARIQSEIYYIRFRRQLRKGHFSAALIKQALDAMVDSRQQELAALVSYNAMLLQYDITLNQFFSKHNINMKSLIEKRKKQ